MHINAVPFLEGQLIRDADNDAFHLKTYKQMTTNAISFGNEILR